jgi:hypothetical protein
MPKSGDLAAARGLKLHEVLQIKGGLLEVTEIRAPYITLKVLTPEEIRKVNWAAKQEHDARERIDKARKKH